MSIRVGGGNAAYSEGWDRIFGKRRCECHLHDRQVCDICQGHDPANQAPDRRVRAVRKWSDIKRGRKPLPAELDPEDGA